MALKGKVFGDLNLILNGPMGSDFAGSQTDQDSQQTDNEILLKNYQPIILEKSEYIPWFKEIIIPFQHLINFGNLIKDTPI